MPCFLQHKKTVLNTSRSAPRQTTQRKASGMSSKLGLGLLLSPIPSTSLRLISLVAATFLLLSSPLQVNQAKSRIQPKTITITWNLTCNENFHRLIILINKNTIRKRKTNNHKCSPPQMISCDAPRVPSLNQESKRAN